MQKLILPLVILTATPALAAIDCAMVPTCDSLGYTDKVSVCPRDYLPCPFDNTMAKCLLTAEPGSVQYFTKAPGKGWLQCNGYYYSKEQYPDLYAAIGTTIGGSGSIFQVPDYQGDFLRVYGGNSGSVNKRQQESLPNLSGASSIVFYDANNSLSTSGVFSSSNVGTAGYDSGRYNLGQGTITFDASRSNAIYGKSSHVTPVNTAVYAYMYAGRVDSSAASAATTAASCVKGNYLYTDGTCSSSYTSSKTVKGIVSSVSNSTSYTAVTYVWGGYDWWSNYSQVEDSCRSQGNGYPAYYTYWSVVPTGIPSTSNLRAPQAGMYYWNGSGRYYCSSASSCSSTSTTSGGSGAGSASNPYYYCYATMYFAG